MATASISSSNYPNVFEAELPSIAYEHFRNPDEAHQLIAQVRERSPIAIGPHGPEALTYELVQAVLRSEHFATPPGLGLDMQGITSGPVWDRAFQGILSLRGEPHQRLRRLVSKAFAPRAVTRMHSLSIKTITNLVDPVSHKGNCDVVSDIALQYPIPIICALLGTPPEDWQFFSDCIDGITKLFAWNVVNDAPEIEKAWDALDAYIDAMVTERRAAPADDLISDLIQAEDHGDRLTHDELLMLATNLLSAATHSMRNQLAAAVQVLCDHPDQWTLLAQHPELAPAAVDEIMRYYPVIWAPFRQAVDDVELGGLTIPAGTLVIANTAAANRDPATYDDPDRFDITREDPAPMLSFSWGPHYCLGSHLAKIELSEALRVITRRMPNPSRRGRAPWKPIVGITGPTSLPIEFDPGY